MELKNIYSAKISEYVEKSMFLSRRLFETYNSIAKRVIGSELKGINVDLGAGNGSFSMVCKEFGIESYNFDYKDIDLEKDRVPVEENSVDFVTMNAVIEHISDPSNVLSESYRMLKTNGLIFIRTPNWKMDYKNFYNDPTHVKPYSPETIRNILTLFGFDALFIEPGLVKKSRFWWKLPNFLKWRVASLIKGGTKSIIAVGRKY